MRLLLFPKGTSFSHQVSIDEACYFAHAIVLLVLWRRNSALREQLELDHAIAQLLQDEEENVTLLSLN